MLSNLDLSLDEFHSKVSSYKEPWIIKSLDPSSPLVGENISIPDGCPHMISSIEYRQTTVLSKPDDITTSTWNIDMNFIPHPFIWSSYTSTDANAANAVQEQILNTQIFDSSQDTDYTYYFCNLCERSRISYMSITVELSAPATASQGTVYAIQYKYVPSITNILTSVDVMSRHVLAYDINDAITVSQSQQSKQAYDGLAIDGAFLVMKLGPEAREWKTAQDTYQYAHINGVANFGEFDTSFVVNANSDPIFIHDRVEVDDDGHFVAGDGYPPPYTTDAAKIWFKGIDASASLKVTIRQGLEYICRPGENYYPMAKFGADPNPSALIAHDAAWRLFCDAYPACYNKSGKFVQVVGKALKFISKYVMPGLGSVPVIGPIAQATDPLLKNIITTIQKKEKSKKKPVVVQTPLPKSKNVIQLRKRRLAILNRKAK